MEFFCYHRPTFTSDGETLTGSVHILDLRRWRNVLGRTMWDFPGGPTTGNRYLVLGLGGPDPAAAGLDAPPDSDDLIAYGPGVRRTAVTGAGVSR
jgi:hypothetical protein